MIIDSSSLARSLVLSKYVNLFSIFAFSSAWNAPSLDICVANSFLIIYVRVDILALSLILGDKVSNFSPLSMMLCSFSVNVLIKFMGIPLYS